MNTIKIAIDRVGSSELARRLGCSKQLVSFWRTGRQRITAERAIEIERVTDMVISRHDLRPDIFGPSPTPREAA